MPNANSLVTLIKGDSTTIDNTEILDGQILFDETRHKIYMDDNSTRDSYGGGGNEENIAYVESGTTASRGYPKGSYVIVNEQLYKTLVQINSGTTFVVDTNIEATSVGTELGRSITQAEYDLLPASQKSQGIWYITDSASTSSIDTTLSITSENPVQNKVITGEINQIKSKLTDNTYVLSIKNVHSSIQSGGKIHVKKHNEVFQITSKIGYNPIVCAGSLPANTMLFEIDDPNNILPNNVNEYFGFNTMNTSTGASNNSLMYHEHKIYATNAVSASNGASLAFGFTMF